MTAFIVSNVNSFSLKVIPIAIIVQCLFSIYNSLMGRMVIYELPVSSRILKKNEFRNSMFMYNIVLCAIMILISGIYLYSVW